MRSGLQLVGGVRTELPESEFDLQCPRCEKGRIAVGTSTNCKSFVQKCAACKVDICCENGIWRALRAGRASYFAQFITDYEFIRSAEGRGSDSSDYYLALPDLDLSGRNAAQWPIRAGSFHYMERRVLPAMIQRFGPRLRILDLGAGNCWMSYRLALAGHAPVAVDLLTNDQDGLGAAVHYRSHLASMFSRVQAELDHLPFLNGYFDVVVFNASFHYSENYESTLAEALRCTRPGGLVVIADTPWYAREESGLRMVAERRAYFTARYGFASDALRSREYITDEDLNRLSERFDFSWKIYSPFYNLKWSLRPLLARLHRHRIPSRFRIYTAEARA